MTEVKRLTQANSLGELIRLAREREDGGMSVRDFATKLGVGFPRVAEAESGKTPRPMVIIARMIEKDILTKEERTHVLLLLSKLDIEELNSLIQRKT